MSQKTPTLPEGMPPGAPVPQPRPTRGLGSGRPADPRGSPSGERRLTMPKKRAETLPDLLADKLRLRRDGKTPVWTLDLRGLKWSAVRPTWCAGFLTLRDPQSTEWPKKGATTADRDVAQGWITNEYALWLARELEASRRSAVSGITTGDAARAYMAALKVQYPLGHNTRTGRELVIHKHILPALEDVPLSALDRARVRPLLERLTVTKRKGGKVVEAPASTSTRDTVRDALRCIWRHHHGDTPAPFAGIKFAAKPGSVGRREAAEAGLIGGVSIKAYTDVEVRRLLAYAAAMDRTYELANLRHLFPHSVVAAVLQIGTGARVEEATLLRWLHVWERSGAVFIPGTKSDNAPRWVPLQLSLLPWLTFMRELRGCTPASQDFLLPRRRREPHRHISDRTLISRMDRVQVAAGLKVPQKATHILRATHVTWLLAAGIEAATVKQYAGHSHARGGATDAYVDRRPPFFPPEHRECIMLPTPEEIRELALSLEGDLGFDIEAECSHG